MIRVSKQKIRVRWYDRIRRARSSPSNKARPRRRGRQLFYNRCSMSLSLSLSLNLYLRLVFFSLRVCRARIEPTAIPCLLVVRTLHVISYQMRYECGGLREYRRGPGGRIQRTTAFIVPVYSPLYNSALDPFLGYI